MKVDFSGINKKFNLKSEKIDQKPFFHDLNPDIKYLKKFAKDYMKYQKIIIIGNGGAVNSFLVLYKSLYSGNKQVEILNSMEPDLINKLKKTFNVKDTLVIVSSTSGTNVGVLEIMSQFLDYKKVIITAENDAALYQIATKKNIPHLSVPHITDRFLTSGAMAYFPLILLGIDVEKIDKFLHKAYNKYSKSNSDALKLSLILKKLEDKGYSEVFVPIYSNFLESFQIFIMQLMHESVCKDGKGQTFIVVCAPESQHHTNQRFFGGNKNICGLFIVTNQEDNKTITKFSNNLFDIKLRNGTIFDINNVPLAKSFEFEFIGTYNDALENKIPSCVLDVGEVNEENVAELIAFWHYMAVYSSILRDVNPFDQPQVEKSKEIAFEMRKKTK